MLECLKTNSKRSFKCYGKIDVKYRYCNKTGEVVKAGYFIWKQQRYQCNQCNRYFQLDYINNASKPGVKEQIVEMAINGSGVKDTVRVLKAGINTVIRILKKSSIRNGKSFYQHNWSNYCWSNYCSWNRWTMVLCTEQS